MDKMIIQQYVSSNNRIHREIYVRLSEKNTLNELEFLSNSSGMPIIFRDGIPYYQVLSMEYALEVYDLPPL